MAKLNITSLFVMALLASPSFAMFFGSEPRGIEDMDAREFDVMFRREVQAHHDVWLQVDEKLRVIDLPWFPFLAKTFLVHYREFALKQDKKTGNHAAAGGPVSSPAAVPPTPAGGSTAPVSMPIPVIPAIPIIPTSPPIIADTHGAQAAVAARDYIEDLIERAYSTFSGSELDARGFTDADEDFFAREPQPQVTDELYERGFDGDELYERGFDGDDVYERGFDGDELYERGFDDELYERGYDDELLERSVDDDLLEMRGIDDFVDVDAREAGDFIDEVFARDYYFDDLD